MTSQEGFCWTPSTGLISGLPCVGAINPPEHKLPSSEVLFDVIVIGAGYAGLVAARDLTTQGRKVLLLEGRDRIGGRTWNSNIDGFNYEMGGTWIHWEMPHIYREVSLYGLQEDWIVTQVEGGKLDFCTITTPDGQRNVSHEEDLAIFTKAWPLFCDIDGTELRETIPYPLMKCDPKRVAEWDKLSCQGRIDQIRHKLTTQEVAVLTATILQMGGGPLENMSFLESMRWYALGGWTPTGLNDIALRTRLKTGQSNLARKIFDHATSTGRLSYAFKTPVAKVIEHNGIVTVETRSKRSFKAHQVISTIPLNVLGDITFYPPLNPLKRQALKQGHTNRGNKIHADVTGPDLVSWTSFAVPGKGMICGLADNITPAGDTHLVLFGPTADSPTGIYLKDGVDVIKKSIEHLLPSPTPEITRIVYHDWFADEFAKGTWCYYPPDFANNYLEALRARHGNVHFAGADWSYGWRGWIDGAVEQGMQVAMTVQQELAVPISSQL